jgi:hypothetical protein
VYRLSRLITLWKTCRTNPWIHQAFEGYDNLSPEKLMEKWKL